MALAATGPARAEDTPVRRVLITGCSSGFGRLTALELARRGHRVAATMRHLDAANADAASELRAIARDEGRTLSVHEIDVDEPASVERGVAAAREAMGGIDVAVSNAGIGIPSPVELSMDAIERTFRTNLFGPLRVARAVLPGMRKRRSGLVVFVSSGLGRLTLPGIAAYCGSKHGGEAMHEALAYEVADHGIDVSIVQPSGFDTDFNANARAYHAELMASLTAEQRERADAYDEVIAFARRLVGDYPQPDPQAVATAIADLIELPEGQRPLRRTVGRSLEGVDRINDVMGEVQEGVMRASGLGRRLPAKRA